MLTRGMRQALMVLALAVSILYLWYRGQYTLNLETNYAIFASLLLYSAEAWGFLSMCLYFFQVWDLSEPAEQPILEGRTVDVFVPTYNEDVLLLRTTLQACLDLDYPHRTYVLDDGRRDEVRELADELGVRYITRDSNQHAKAGNLNHALEQTDGEFIIIFDADHVPQKRFINRLIGYFRDEKCGFVQTPHAFYNFDNFQGSCNFNKKKYWDDGLLFYKVIQRGLNRWNAVIFAGSAAIFRRKALEEVGYIAVETITEDMHTGIRMTALGWKTVYVSEPLISGQAAPDVTTFHSQRLRWGEGNLSILFIDNPLLMRGLTIPQRLSYFSSIISWSAGFSRIALYLTPPLLLLTGVAPLKEFTWTLGIILASYLLITQMSLRLVSGKNWSLFDIELFSMASFWTQIRSMFRAVFRRKKSKFVVTSKRGRQSDSLAPYIAPQLVLISISFIALVWGALRLVFNTSSDWYGPGIGGPLCMFYIYLAWVVVRRAMGAADQRFAYRHNAVLPVSFSFEDTGGEALRGMGVTADLSEAGINLVSYRPLEVGMSGRFMLRAGEQAFECRGKICHAEDVNIPKEAIENPEIPVTYRYGVHFSDLSPEQTDELHRIALHFAVPQLYSHFDSRVSRTKRLAFRILNVSAWKKREGRKPYRMPLVLGGEPGGASTFAVSEDLSRSAARLLTSTSFEVGRETRFLISTPLGEIEGKARIVRSDKRTFGPLEMWENVIAFTKFDGQGRGTLHSLLQPLDEESVQYALCARSKDAPQPLFQPLAIGLLSAAVLVPSSMAVFRSINSDDLFLQEAVSVGLQDEMDYQRFESIYRKALNSLPSNSQLSMLGELMMRQDRSAEAEELTRLMLSSEPHNLDLRKALADTLANLKQHEEAEQEYLAILETLRTTTDIVGMSAETVLLASARNLVHSGNTELALERFGELIGTARAVDHSVISEYAGVLVSTKQYGKAEELLANSHGDPDSLFTLAGIYSAQERFDETETVCRRILSIRPEHIGGRRLLGDVLAWRNDFSSAALIFAELMEDEPDNVDFARRYAELTLWGGSHESSLEIYRQLLIEDISRTSLWQGFLDAAAGAQTKASRDLELCAEIGKRLNLTDSDDTELLSRLASVLLNAGQPKQAIALLENVIRQSPRDRRARLLLADTLNGLGKYRQADQHYTALLGNVQEKSFRPPVD